MNSKSEFAPVNKSTEFFLSEYSALVRRTIMERTVLHEYTLDITLEAVAEVEKPFERNVNPRYIFTALDVRIPSEDIEELKEIVENVITLRKRDIEEIDADKVSITKGALLKILEQTLRSTLETSVLADRYEEVSVDLRGSNVEVRLEKVINDVKIRLMAIVR